MKNDKGPLAWITRLLKPKEEESKEKKPPMYLYAVVVLLLGTGIMIAGNVINTDPPPSTNDTAESVFNQNETEEDVEVFGKKGNTEFKNSRDYEVYLQNEMKDALESIAGVEDVKVVVYVEASEKNIYEKNKTTQRQVTDETDQEGGKRTVEDTSVDEQLVIIKNSDKEGPVIAETRKPQVSGVLVVAKGADNIQIKKWIIEAVTRALDVPSHRVSVLPKK
ncbi:stage III sporulation protein AG [Peribacillus psychrosaccharolyticus]|uniref:Stage III sporulation protein AG n=1 Tax=Peribacillus psychrosaccharolyticus TaxID=1407 RepID=A0A974NLH6_PERPY|nr:stage III sporulation protein AG [Peribacillus psychrosaccharolyticus]MEC2056875.1 stage III sporulation protein AG [Peribacillus psychrosaccharolyticus]MED3746457.1 stage III sporulation protein AG [Peribacillus psychrosaccharolyticus]QQT00004.1 stage III sporulation protein AG [Peribacillus psychrosaccharolyticus]